MVIKSRREFLARLVAVDYDSALSLSESLKIDKDFVNIQKVVNFYENGDDLKGEQMAISISSRQMLCSELLQISRKRFAILIQEKSAAPGYKEAISCIPPDIHDWALKSISGSNSILHPSKHDSMHRLNQLLNLLERLSPQENGKMEEHDKVYKMMRSLQNFPKS